MPLPQNPIRDPDAFDFLIAAGRQNPGIAKLVSGGDRDYKWDIKDPKGSEGSTATYNGWKISDKITFRFEFWISDQIDEFYEEYVPVLQYDAAKSKPKPIAVYHPALAANQITKLITVKIGPLVDLGNQLWSVTVVFDEFLPPKSKNVSTTPENAKNAAAKKRAAGKHPDIEDQLDASNRSLYEEWKRPFPSSP